MSAEGHESVLVRDLCTADGRVVAPRGTVADMALLRRIASRPVRGQRLRPLHETALAAPVLEALEAPALQLLAGDDATRAEVADALAEVRLPQNAWDELEAMRLDDDSRFQHALWTAIAAARMYRCALRTAPGITRIVAGALLHDVGMRHASLRLRWNRVHLTREEALALEDHPLLGALILASILGDSPPVQFALLHHTRAGFGYPRVSLAPAPRGLDLISVASAFAALVAARPWRDQVFNARGAVDQLLEEAVAGHFDVRTVRLLVHCLRSGREPVEQLQLSRHATGFRPAVNHHGVSPETSRLTA